MTTRRSFVAATAAAATQAFQPSSVMAQSFPSKAIHFIVPFPVGGSADVLARLVGQHMTQRWGPAVLVDPRPGGGTVIGTSLAAKAPADGHTILFIANSFVINAKLRTNLPYDGIKAFEPVAMMVSSPQVIAVSASSPFRTFKEWLDAARAQPGTQSLATLGPATAQHIAAEMLQRATGVRLIYAAYPGSVQAVSAVLGGHVGCVLANLADMSSHLEAGKLRPLAVTTTERLEALKNVPTVAESGYPGYEVVAWFGVAAPAGTPRATVDKLAEGVNAALNDTDIRQKIAAIGLQSAYMDPAAFSTHIAQQYERYARVIDEAKITAD